jgi:MFS family permease
MLASLLLMAAGSAICGASTSVKIVIQGLGGGGIAATTAIIISDMVPLQERGVFNGLVSM